MVIISDKRLTKFEGKRLFFGNDDFIKHHIINKNLCFMPGSFMRADNQPAKRLATLIQFADYPTSKLIKIVELMDRRYVNIDGQLTHDHAILCGLTDENTFFIMCCQPDGSFTCQLEKAGRYTLSIATNGEHLQQPTGEFLAHRINEKGDSLLEALKRTVKYVSTIEKTVSPTFTYSIISK